MYCNGMGGTRRKTYKSIKKKQTMFIVWTCHLGIFWRRPWPLAFLNTKYYNHRDYLANNRRGVTSN